MDLAGKTFIYEAFEDDPVLIWFSFKEKYVGKQAEILFCHERQPYAFIKINDYGIEAQQFYPISIIERQLNLNSVEDLYKEIFKLTKEICK
jgi:hypothetical protein